MPAINKITVQSPKKFEKTIKNLQEVCPFPRYNVTDGIVSTEPKFTMNANTCTILGMSNGEETYIGHFAPETRKYDFLDKLDYIIKKFQDKTGEISAVITGGHDFHNLSCMYKSEDSYRQLADIGNLLEKNNIENVTMIAAKKIPLFNDNLAITKDRFILSHSPHKLNNPIKFQENIHSQQELENIFNNHYSIVEISPQHNIDYLG